MLEKSYDLGKMIQVSICNTSTANDTFNYENLTVWSLIRPLFSILTKIYLKRILNLSYLQYKLPDMTKRWQIANQ